MDLPFPLLAFAVVAVLLLVASMARRAPSKEYRPPSFDRRPPFTPAERSFLGVLDRAVEGRLRVLGKVRLADLVKLRPGLSRSEAATASNKIRMKHVDFVLCSRTDLSVVAVVELDDASHRTRRTRDALVDDVLASAGIPVHRFSAKVAYSVGDVRKILGQVPPTPEAASSGLMGEPSPRSAGHGPGPEPVTSSGHVHARPDRATSPDRLCPECGRELVQRSAKCGARAGTSFIGCSGYPACRYTASA